MIARVTVFLLFAAGFFVDAAACECARMSVEDGLKASEYVFGARVVGAVVKGGNVSIELSGVANIKGGFDKKKLTTNSTGSGCGFVVRVPEDYVFFLGKDGSLSACGATRVLLSPELGGLNDRVLSQWSSRAKKP